MPNRTVNHNNRNRAAYQVDGNTVRRMEAMPDYRKERRDRQEREREEELRKRRRAAARNQEKALRMSKSYVVFLTMAVTVFGIFCGAYIKLQSDVTARMKAIASLESQVTDLKADNDEAYKRINTAVADIFPCISRYSNTITSAWFSSAYLMIAPAIFFPSSIFRRFVYAHLPRDCAEPCSLWNFRIRPSVRYIQSFSLG